MEKPYKLARRIPMFVIKKSKSYSLMEVLIAIAVIIAIMLGVTLLNNASMRNTTMAKHRLQVALFAQEQMEILRNMRDTGIIMGDWEQFFSTVCENTNNQQFRVFYNDVKNRYLLTPIIEPQKVTTQHLTFRYYLECTEIENINSSESTTHFVNTNKPKRFRILIRWYEYGQERTYILNNYLTNLETI